MNTPLRLSALLILGALCAVRLSAAVESFKVEATVKPPLSPTMLMEGITEGKLVVAVDVSAEGQLTDCLVLAYTHPGLVTPCLDAIKQWKFTPARIDGVPVPAQAELTINYSAQGVVVSRSSITDIDQQLQRMFGYRFARRPGYAGELDSAPTRLTTVTPAYAKDAEKQGVRGTVTVFFYIDENGDVRMPCVEAGAHPYLSDAAVAAVRSWKFQPPMAHGKPVLVAARQDFKFGQ